MQAVARPDPARPSSASILGAGPGVAAATKPGEKEIVLLPPRNDVVKSVSAPTNKTFAGADKQNPCNNSTSEATVRQSEIRMGTSQRAASSGQESKQAPNPVKLPAAERSTGVESADAGESPH